MLINKVSKLFSDAVDFRVQASIVDSSVEDMGDLFNFLFNKKESCFDKKYEMSQSMYLFLAKFGGTEGIINYLKTSYGAVTINIDNKKSIHYRKEENANRGKGIIADKDDIQWRQNQFGTNDFPEFKTMSTLDLIWEAFGDKMLKILIVASVLSIIVDVGV